LPGLAGCRILPWRSGRRPGGVGDAGGSSIRGSRLLRITAAGQPSPAAGQPCGGV